MFPGKTSCQLSVRSSQPRELGLRSENCELRTESFARRAHAAILALLAIVALSACRAPQKMADNPAYEPYEASRFFDDGMSARQPVPGTVARGTLREDTLLYTGKVGGQLANAFPFEITRADVLRGKERFEIYCTPCHGATGAGDGMIVQRGYRRPPSYHSDRLRQVPVGHFVDVMTNGFGVMPSYANQVPVRDRWLIAAYIKALQLSQNVPVAEVPPVDRAKIPTGGAQ